jgi:CheY-like chemotaxis protein
MEAIGQLAGGVAHDFNNLLQGIQGYASLAMLDLGSDEKSYERLSEIVAAVERGGTLVRQLLTFSRREEIHPTDLDLNKLVGAIMEMLRRVIGEHIELTVIPGHELQVVRADPVQIEQILLNLCVNARDAMPDGGRIVIETENVEIGRAFCQRHPWAETGDYVLISVSDTGRGIPPEILEHIFEPFFTTKERHKGTGLGLATVYGIIKQHGGLINVYSEVGEGTVFKIYMPVVEPGMAAAEIVDGKSGVPGGTETILLAEDEQFVREVAFQMLEGAGYRVLVACDGKEAADAIEAHGDEIDLALLDVVMPRMGGQAVYRRIKALGVKIPVLFSSGYSFKALTDEESPDEPFQLIQKPYKPDELLFKVRQLLDEAKG